MWTPMRHRHGYRARAVKPRRPRIAPRRALPFEPLFHISILFAVAAGFALASRMPQFAVEKVVVRGGDVSLRRAVRERIALPPDASTLTVNLAKIRRAAEQDPRVAMATVTRCLPHRIEVEIVTREARAAIKDGDEYVLVDASGICFARRAEVPEGLDELWGIDVGHGRPGARIGSAQLGIAFRCIALADRYAPGTRWAFDFTDPSNIVMRGPHMKAYLGTSENLDYKMAIVFAAPKAAREKNLASYTIDVRRAEAPVLTR